jgi:hypothetical protein
MIPLKIPHLRRCLDFLVTAVYDKYVLHLRHFERNHISGFFAVQSIIKAPFYTTPVLQRVAFYRISKLTYSIFRFNLR